MTTGVGDRNFHVDIFTPSGNDAGLLRHFVELVGEDFEGNRPVGNGCQNLAGERTIVGEAGLAHERGIRRESFDDRIGIKPQHTGLVRAVGKYLHVQIAYFFCLHEFTWSCVVWTTYSIASASDFTVWSGAATGHFSE